MVSHRLWDTFAAIDRTAWTRWVNVESIGKPTADLDVKHIVSPPA